MNTRNLAVALVAVAMLSGCKQELFRQLGESEANQMLALLMVKQIPAEKVLEKDGTVTLKVDDKSFVDAVELMRQNGYPRKTDITVEQLFPAGQLVTSPAQERAKMVFLKERRIESMLSSMDGVMDTKVTLADAVDENGNPMPGTRAGLFIKYSPEFNLQTQQAQIKALVMNSVPGLTPDQISLVMQPGRYRFMPDVPTTMATQPAWMDAIRQRLWLVALFVASTTVALAFGVSARWTNRRRAAWKAKQ
jgi:type III secretion protein J